MRTRLLAYPALLLPTALLACSPQLSSDPDDDPGGPSLLDVMSRGADAAPDPPARARAFLADFGALVGMSAAERHDLPVAVGRVIRESSGASHVRLAQQHAGLPVIGAEIVVHMDDRGITGVNGTWVPDVAVATSPRLTSSQAVVTARGAGGKEVRVSTVGAPRLAVYPVGLVAGRRPVPRLAWGVEVAGGAERWEIWVDAQSGRVLDRVRLNHAVRD